MPSSATAPGLKRNAYLAILCGRQAVAQAGCHSSHAERRTGSCYYGPVLCAALCSMTRRPPQLRQAIVAKGEQRPIFAHYQ